MMEVRFSHKKGIIMGSTGSGNFTDYTGTTAEGNQTGGTSGQDKCDLAISCSLEDVAQSSFYSSNRNVPAVGSTVVISFKSPRIVAIDTGTGQDCGALPTSFNYLLTCIENGYQYGGIVTNSVNSLNPLVAIDVGPVVTP